MPTHRPRRTRAIVAILCGGISLAVLAARRVAPPPSGHVPRPSLGFVMRFLDADGDGYLAASVGGPDCDDGNPDIHPSEPEVCDGVDQDCNGVVDEGVTTLFYADADGDGYGDPDVSEARYDVPISYVADSADCDDADAAVHPGTSEICGDGKDNDCSGLMDCEELVCEGTGTCGEIDCTDGVDGDGDGLTDCADDDCWGLACGAVVARVTGGRMRLESDETLHRWGHDGKCVNSGSWYRRSIYADATSVTGTVQVQPDPDAAVETCTWTAAHVNFASRYKRSRAASSNTTRSSGCTGRDSSEKTTVTSAVPIRDGFAVAAGCDLSSSGFLPGVLQAPSEGHVMPWPTAAGAAWYTGKAVRTSSTGSITTGSIWGWSSFRSTWEVDPLLPGDTYTAPP